VDSNTTGHAGPRLGCCKIILSGNNPSSAAALHYLYSTLMVVLTASWLLLALVQA